MKILVYSLASAFFLAVITVVHATTIVYGTITGTVTRTSGNVRTTVGMPVWGTFSYDYDLLMRDPFSLWIMVGNNDVNAMLYLWSSAGEGGGGQVVSPFFLDSNRLPFSGVTGTTPSIHIGPLAGVVYNSSDAWTAHVNYTITGGLPDGGATWLLLGLGLAGITVARRLTNRPAPRSQSPSD